jgi:TfoX/Sxy family transcriptional regulator of competence genes
MPYSEKLADRIRKSWVGLKGVAEKKMMGGLTFMVNDKMCVGILDDDLMVRLNPEMHAEALARKGCREMDFTGKPMRGFVFVGPEGIKTQKDLDYWLEVALAYNALAKSSKKKKSTGTSKSKGPKKRSSQ